MTRTTINFILDVILLLTFVGLLIITSVLRFLFPVASHAAGWTVLGGSYLAWFNAQFIDICVLAGLVLLHVMLHWTWVCGVVSGWIGKRGSGKPRLDDGSRTLYGVGILIAICTIAGLLLALASLTVRGPAN